MALHLTNHLFVLIGSILSICPVISNSILKTVKRRLCPLSTMFPHATYFDGQRHNEMSTATAWRKLGMCLNHQFFRIFWDHSMTPGPKQCSVTREIPRMTHRFVWFDSQKTWSYLMTPGLVRGIYSFFLESGLRVRQSAHEMTRNRYLWWQPPSMEEVLFKHHGSPTGHGRALWRWQCQVNSSIDGNKKWPDIMTSRFFVQLLFSAISWSLTHKALFFHGR